MNIIRNKMILTYSIRCLRLWRKLNVCDGEIVQFHFNLIILTGYVLKCAKKN